MRYNGYPQHEVKKANEIWASLPAGLQGHIERYLTTDLADPFEVKQADIKKFIENQEGMAIVKSIIRYGKMCATAERKRIKDQNQMKIDKLRSILGAGL